MKVYAFVPVRGGSKSIPLKNIRHFCGKPLVFWCLSSLVNSKYVDRIFAATDSNKIKEVVQSFGFDKVVVYDREPANATDEASTESVIIEFLNKVSLEEDSLFVLVQTTNPFIQSFDIDKAIEEYKKTKCDSLLSCARLKKFIWTEDGEPLNYDYTNRPRRQDFKGIFIENGSFYINTVKNILTFKNRLCGKIFIYEMPEYTHIEIDEEYDWLIAEQIFKKYLLDKVSSQFNVKKIKLVMGDVDGTLTDGGIYYSEEGETLIKFNRQDGMGFEILEKYGIKSGIITKENSLISKIRAEKLKLDYVFVGVQNKFEQVKTLCKEIGISLENVAYIGDDINCKEILENVGIAACPTNAVDEIKNIPNIIKLSRKGGEGAFREFVDIIVKNYI